MLTPEQFTKEAHVHEPSFIGWIRRAALLSPFVVKAVLGFEWAVLVSLFVGLYYLASLLRGLLLDTTSLSLLAQHDHNLWHPPESD